MSAFQKQIINKIWVNTWIPVVMISINSAVAEESISDSVELTVIQVTAHRLEQDINDIPASVSVIENEDIQRLQPYSQSDLFRYEPGITIEKSGSRHGDGNINIRGIGGNRVIILQDGVRMPKGFGSAGVDQGRGSINALNLERVEVLKGPASALYGSDALGGVVLYETLDPERLVLDNDGLDYLQFSSGYSSVDERYRATITAATEVGDGYGLLQVDHQGFSELDVNSDFDPNPKDGEVNSILAKWSVSTSNNQHWDFIADFWRQEADNKLDTNLVPVSGPPGSAITHSTATDESERWHVGVHHTLEQTLGLDVIHWHLDYQGSLYKQDEEELQQSPGSVFPPIPATSYRTIEEEEFEQQQWSFDFSGQKTIGTHTFVGGLDLLRKDYSRPVDKTIINEINGTSTKVNSGVQYPGKTFPDTQVDQVGVYLQDSWSINERLELLAGIRYDYFKSDPDADEAYNNFNLSGTKISARSEDHWSPHLGTTFDLNNQHQVYANYATGFRAPPVDDQFISRAILIPVAGVPHEVVPNADLGPETSEGYEIGWRWNNAHFNASLAYYDTQYEDFIDSRTIGYRDQPPVYVGATSIRQIQYQNVDEVAISGVEFHSIFHLNSWLDMKWQADLSVGFNLIDAENKVTGEGLNSVGPNTAVLGLSFKNPASTVGFDWFIRAAAEADDAESLERHGQKLTPYEPPGYAVHDVSVFWKPHSKVRIDAAVYNVFDKKYWSANAKGADASGDLDAQAEPGTSFAVNLSYQF